MVVLLDQAARDRLVKQVREARVRERAHHHQAGAELAWRSSNSASTFDSAETMLCAVADTPGASAAPRPCWPSPRLRRRRRRRWRRGAREPGQAAGGEAGDGALGGAAAVVGDEDLLAERPARRRRGPAAPGASPDAGSASRVCGIFPLGLESGSWRRGPSPSDRAPSIFPGCWPTGRPTTSRARPGLLASRQRARTARASRSACLCASASNASSRSCLNSSRRCRWPRRRGCPARRRWPARPASRRVPWRWLIASGVAASLLASLRDRREPL